MVYDTRPWMTSWAKSLRDPLDHETVFEWLPLHEHLADASAVAALLMESWVPARVVDRIAADLGGTRHDVAVLVRWLAAVHDVGKISPAFAAQAPTLTGTMGAHGLVVRSGIAVHPSRSLVRHERVGELAVRDWLTSLGFDNVTASQFASIVGAHHGVPPMRTHLREVKALGALRGVGPWEEARRDALRWATDLVGGDTAFARFDKVRLSLPAQVLCSAVVIMADWIASNAELFPLRPASTSDEVSRPEPCRTAARASEAWTGIDLPPRWVAQPIVDASGQVIGVFRRSADARNPRPPPHWRR